MPFVTQQALDRIRRELLDLSTRNRLLSIPVGSKTARLVEVRDELSTEVYRLLVPEKKTLTFLPASLNSGDAGAEPNAAEDEPLCLPQPGDREEGKGVVAKRHVDSKLQTTLSTERLQRRLLDLFCDARTMIEEQGINVLYLALGHLKWHDPEEAGTPRFAPLVLVPVDLQRRSASDRFCLIAREEDLQENLSLRAKLSAEFQLKLPEFPEDEDLDIAGYFKAVSETIKSAPGWEILPNAMTLGFFSFAKFLMYRDLDSANWPQKGQLLDHPLVSSLVQGGFESQNPAIPEDADLDTLIPADRLDHVVDADSSQTRAIEMVRKGQSLVIQGPPGTGKSQSITNLIASAILDGRKVLFVSEKLAALEVVKRRLEKEGLGDLCLELHSNKSSKRAVVEMIGGTWKLGKPKGGNLETTVEQLQAAREILNSHARELHEPVGGCGYSPYHLIGQIVLMKDRGAAAAGWAFEGAERWTSPELGARRSIVTALAERIEQIGTPQQHPWRGVTCEPVLAIDLPDLLGQTLSAREAIEALTASVAKLATLLSQTPPGTLATSRQQGVLAEFVANAPALDRSALCSSVWSAGLGGLGGLLEDGKKFSTIQQDLGTTISPTAWEGEFSSARAMIAAHGKSWFRILNGDYRRGIATLRGVTSGVLPPSFEQRLQLMDRIIEGQRCLRAIREGRELGISAFGTAWQGEKTNWGQLDTVLRWVAGQQEAGLGQSFRQMFAAVQDQHRVGIALKEQSGFLRLAEERLTRLCDRLKLDNMMAFGVENRTAVPLPVISQRLREWEEQIQRLPAWNGYFTLSQKALEQGLAPLMEALESGRIPTSQALDCFERTYHSQLLRVATTRNKRLARFDGQSHAKCIEEFRSLDKDRLALSRMRILNTHFESMPKHSGLGAAGILKGELERKRGHKSVRRLLKEAGSVVQSIKPVFMMSPLSVAQFLEPGAVEFDLLIIDEASQVQPVDALGAIARCRQLVVLGDSRQLPPTQFFMRMTSGDASPETDDRDEAVGVRDVESVLGLCCARGLPQTMLRWHYRSRHHSLIAVSNQEFYDNRLFIVPSPHSRSPHLGLRAHHLPDGVFDSGASRTNRVEARAISRAVAEHARNSPELSLGVGAFSIQQRDAILDELELLRRESPEIEEFMAQHPSEPFFVKNLESIQGDERDVIFISVGYAKNADGFMPMQFGPLGREGGERRLNVLISRAKLRCEVFSSIQAEDIDLKRASGKGVAALKAFLTYAASGQLAPARGSAAREAIPFESAVQRDVEALGCTIEARVGTAGFFMDLAVQHPDHPGSYLLGIECDGPSYHSSRFARDRDRLSQSVLEDHGWNIHRIWSTDWLQQPAEQLKKVQQAIDAAKKRSKKAAPLPRPEVVEEAAVTPVKRGPETDLDLPDLSGFSTPYREASFKLPTTKAPHELSDREITTILMRIVLEEGPIHEDEVVIRVRELWKLDRAGARLQEAVAKGIRALLVGNRCAREEGFLSIPGAEVAVRNREGVASAGLKRPEMLPGAEIRVAIIRLIEAHHGATRAELPVVVSRLFGFKTTSANLKSVITRQLERLLRSRELEDSEGMIRKVDATFRG